MRTFISLFITTIISIGVFTQSSDTVESFLFSDNILNSFNIREHGKLDGKEVYLKKEHFKHSSESKSLKMIIGPGHDTLSINADTTYIGDIVLTGKGVLIIDNAQLTLYGSMLGYDNSQVLMMNDAYLFVPQVHTSQYIQAFWDSSRFEAINSEIYANTVYRTFLFDNSSYICKHVEFPYWNFRQMYDNSKLHIEDARMVGDITINDACEAVFIDCDTILPWFGFAAGDTLNIQFPDIHHVQNFILDSTTTGVKGIDYKVTFQSCNMVLWGVESFPMSYVNIYNSIFCGTFRIMGNDTVYLNGIRDRSLYSNLDIPFNDRTFSLNNSYVQIWCIYSYENAVVYMDSCSWGESHARENSYIYADNSVAMGFPSSVTTAGAGNYHFKNGRCRSFVSSWHSSTCLIENSTIIPDRPGGAAQNSNIAHHSSNMFAVNSYFEYLPVAKDTALVIFASIDSLNSINSDTLAIIPITGSAWLHSGPHNPTGFEQYQVHYRHIDSTNWYLISSSTNSLHEDILAYWNIEDLLQGVYLIRLSVYSTHNDSLYAIRKVELLKSSFVNEQLTPEHNSFSIYPNPANTYFTIKSELPYEEILMYDITGKKLLHAKYFKHVTEKTYMLSEANASYNSKIFIKLVYKNGQQETKSLILIK